MKSNWKYIFVSVSLLVVVIAGALYALSASPAKGSDLPITTVHDVFIDVNGDGLADYVRSADVVINSGNLTVSP